MPNTKKLLYSVIGASVLMLTTNPCAAFNKIKRHEIVCNNTNHPLHIILDDQHATNNTSQLSFDVGPANKGGSVCSEKIDFTTNIMKGVFSSNPWLKQTINDGNDNKIGRIKIKFRAYRHDYIPSVKEVDNFHNITFMTDHNTLYVYVREK